MDYSISKEIESFFFELYEKGSRREWKYLPKMFPEFVLAEEWEIPKNHPLSGNPAFGTFSEFEESRKCPLIFVRKDKVPPEFRDMPEEFYQLAAFAALNHASTGNHEQATFKTLAAINDPEIAKRFKAYWMRENGYGGDSGITS